MHITTGYLKGIEMAYFGDLENNVTYDLMRAAALMGFNLNVSGIAVLEVALADGRCTRYYWQGMRAFLVGGCTVRDVLELRTNMLRAPPPPAPTPLKPPPLGLPPPAPSFRLVMQDPGKKFCAKHLWVDFWCSTCTSESYAFLLC